MAVESRDLSFQLEEQTSVVESSKEIESACHELVEFLRHDQFHVKHSAAEALLQLSGSPCFIALCKKDSSLCSKLSRKLVNTIHSKEFSLAQASFEILINISEIPEFLLVFLESVKGVQRVMEFVREESREHEPSQQLITLAFMLLANLTRCQKGQEQLLGITPESTRPQALSELFLNCMVKQLLANFKSFYTEPLTPTSANKKDYSSKRLLYIEYIFVNVTNLPFARQWLLNFGETLDATVTMFNRFCERLINKECSEEEKHVIVQLFYHLTDDLLHDSSILLHPHCLLLDALCCLVYPPLGSRERRIRGSLNFPESGMALNLSCSTADQTQPSLTITYDERESIQLPVFLDTNSCGLIQHTECRATISCIFHALSSSPSGILNEKHQQMLYQVVRVWHLLEKDATIRAHIETYVLHLIPDQETFPRLSREKKDTTACSSMS